MDVKESPTFTSKIVWNVEQVLNILRRLVVSPLLLLSNGLLAVRNVHKE
jgi:hypothetical protein